jgi:hypothetical protein
LKRVDLPTFGNPMIPQLKPIAGHHTRFPADDQTRLAVTPVNERRWSRTGAARHSFRLVGIDLFPTCHFSHFVIP